VTRIVAFGIVLGCLGLPGIAAATGKTRFTILEHGPGDGPELVPRLVVYRDGDAIIRRGRDAYGLIRLSDAERKELYDRLHIFDCAECGDSRGAWGTKTIEISVHVPNWGKTYAFVYERGFAQGTVYVLRAAELEDKSAQLFADTRVALGDAMASQLAALLAFIPSGEGAPYRPEFIEMVIWPLHRRFDPEGRPKRTVRRPEPKPVCKWPADWPWLKDGLEAARGYMQIADPAKPDDGYKFLVRLSPAIEDRIRQCNVFRKAGKLWRFLVRPSLPGDFWREHPLVGKLDLEFDFDDCRDPGQCE
jgi:hypothetical protein